MGIQTVSNPAYTGGFQFPAGTIIAPGQHIVVGGTESQDNTSYDSTFIDFDVSDFVGSNTCDPNTNWLLPNGDGWVGLYNSQGNAVDAVYWSFFSGLNINTDDDFASNPCVPTACSGISVLPSARQIFNSNPALISYVGISTNNDLTFSRVPDGAAWQRNIVPSISNGGNGNCNAACVTPPTPSGSCNGTASVNPSAGTAPYSYLWSTGQTLQTITGLCAGSYSVTVTDANGCSENASVTVTQTDAYQLNATVVQPSCGNNNGCISFDPTPTGTYFYNWPFPTVMNVDSVCGLAPGSYDITITSIDGCSIDTTIILTNSASVTTLTAAITNVSCNSGTNGAMAVTTSGGTAPYTYLWSNGLTTEDITGIGVGTYSLTATDVNGCTGSVSGLNVTQPIAITATVDVTDASCAGNDGAVAITVSGGTGGYNYIWSNGQTLSSIIGLNAGIYTLSITDANNCQLVLSDTVFGTTAITVTGSVINESCADSGSGAVDISFSGGTAPYSFIWSNASTTEDLSEISAGSYSLTLTDDAGCNAFYSATVTAPLLPVLNAQILPTGSQDSTINWGSNAILSGGSDQSALNVTYSWAYTGPGNPLFADQDSIMTAVTPEVDGAYVFIITALSADGCNVSDTLRLNVTEINPAIPTAFSPNKDGNNDLFEVVRLNKSMIKEFKVFNRWGQLLYDDSVLSSWDGKFNGAEQPRDVYIYLISWESPTGNVVKRGQITLMR
jgi:gliding motility-associated-like protein